MAFRELLPLSLSVCLLVCVCVDRRTVCVYVYMYMCVEGLMEDKFRLERKRKKKSISWAEVGLCWYESE